MELHMKNWLVILVFPSERSTVETLFIKFGECRELDHIRHKHILASWTKTNSKLSTGGIVQSNCPEKFCKINRKISLSESTNLGLQLFEKEIPTLVLSCNICNTFQNCNLKFVFPQIVLKRLSFFMLKKFRSMQWIPGNLASFSHGYNQEC